MWLRHGIGRSPVTVMKSEPGLLGRRCIPHPQGVRHSAGGCRMMAVRHIEIGRSREALLAVAAMILVADCATADNPAGVNLQAPPGFVVEQVAGEPQIQFPMFATFDDRGRLYVAESSGLDLY